MRKKVLENYSQDQDLIAAYEEGGKAIGRLLTHDPTQEEYLWKLLGGVKLWPRWYLEGFRLLYRDEHPREHRNAVVRRYRHRRKKRVQWEGPPSKPNDSA